MILAGHSRGEGAIAVTSQQPERAARCVEDVDLAVAVEVADGERPPGSRPAMSVFGLKNSRPVPSPKKTPYCGVPPFEAAGDDDIEVAVVVHVREALK